MDRFPIQSNPTQSNPTQPNPTQTNRIESNRIQSNPIQSQWNVFLGLFCFACKEWCAYRQALPNGKESSGPPASFAVSLTGQGLPTGMGECSRNGWMGRQTHDWRDPVTQSWEYLRLLKLKPGSHCASQLMSNSLLQPVGRLWKEVNSQRGSLRFSILLVVSFSPPKTTSKALDYMPQDSDLSCSSSPCPPSSDTLFLSKPSKLSYYLQGENFWILHDDTWAPSIWLPRTFSAFFS